MAIECKNTMMWALTYRCNMTCEYCFLREKITSWEERSDDECIEIAKKIAKSEKWKPQAVWLTGGEPTVKKCLPEVVKILENAGVRCIITTNAFCKQEIMADIVNADPRGITVSLESFDDDVNDENRGNTKRVIESIKYIAEHKKEYTTLGVSCVISPSSIPRLLEFAHQLKEIGVEYLSMNPLIGGDETYSAEDFMSLALVRKEIQNNIKLKTPSDFYFDLVSKCHAGIDCEDIKCPAGNNYMFISPWGEVFPCSDEKWHKNDSRQKLSIFDFNLDEIMEKIRLNYNTECIGTNTACFGERCVGCWKLYFDTIFT